MAIWDTEEDKAVKTTFRPFLSETAIKMKRNADKGVSAKEDKAAAGDDDDSDFEDVESDHE